MTSSIPKGSYKVIPNLMIAELQTLIQVQVISENFAESVVNFIY
jgi:hypothetical protein